MAYKRKYQMGERITSLDELVKQEFVYCHGKITHAGWARSWQIGLALRYISVGALHYAVKLEDEKVEVNENVDQ